MRFSEAIRLGAAITPQAFKRRNDKDGGTCALGSAALGYGLETAESRLPIVPHLLDEAVCPVAGCTAFKYAVFLDIKTYNLTTVVQAIHVITHLNDHHRWSREQIADWFELNYETDSITKEPATNPTKEDSCTSTRPQPIEPVLV